MHTQKMKSPNNNSCHGWRAGLTLIEVVIGIAIAGTLLVSTIMATNAHRRQIKKAEQKRAAIESIDQFLSVWSRFEFDARRLETASKQSGVTVHDGPIDARLQPNVRFTVRTSNVNRQLNLEVVRVEAWLREAPVPLSWIEVVRPRRIEP